MTTMNAEGIDKLRTGNFEQLRGGHRNLPGAGTTHGEWRGVTQLARVKSRGRVPPARPAGIRKPKVGR
jgi:hypothetical protein